MLFTGHIFATHVYAKLRVAELNRILQKFRCYFSHSSCCFSSNAPAEHITMNAAREAYKLNKNITFFLLIFLLDQYFEFVMCSVCGMYGVSSSSILHGVDVEWWCLFTRSFHSVVTVWSFVWICRHCLSHTKPSCIMCGAYMKSIVWIWIFWTRIPD